MYKICAIQFEGNKKTKEKIVLRELNIKVGDSISVQKINSIAKKNCTNLFNLLLFKHVDYKYEITDSGCITFKFILAERQTLLYNPVIELADRNFNVWWYDQKANLERLNYGAAFTKINVGGRNETIKTSLLWGYRRFAEVEYIIPYIDRKLKNGAGVKINYASGKELFDNIEKNKQIFFKDNNENPYKRWLIELDYYYRPAVQFTNKFALLLTYWKINDAMFAANPNFLGNNNTQLYVPEINYTLISNKVNDVVYPIIGTQIKLIVGRKGIPYINNAIQQNYMHLFFAKYFTYKHRFLFSFINRSRISSLRAQPFVNNRALGFGNEYVRGFEYYVVDGNIYSLQRASIKYDLFHQHFSSYKLLDKNLPLYIYPKIYVDAGYVNGANYNNGFLNNTLLVGYDAGLDIYFRNSVRIRMEYTFNNFKKHAAYWHTTTE